MRLICRIQGKKNGIWPWKISWQWKQIVGFIIMWPLNMSYIIILTIKIPYGYHWRFSLTLRQGDRHPASIILNPVPWKMCHLVNMWVSLCFAFWLIDRNRKNRNCVAFAFWLMFVQNGRTQISQILQNLFFDKGVRSPRFIAMISCHCHMMP
jgi:hypothetical protein